MKKLILAPFFLAAILLQGCQIAPDPKAYAAPVTVVKKEDKTPFLSMSKVYKYVVKDAKGRNSVVASYSNAFEVGECATLWRSYSSKHASYRYYPRIAAANADCSAFTPEPVEESYYFYRWQDAEKMGFQFYSYTMDTWLDTPLQKLLDSWGNPNKVSTDANGVMHITYKKGYTKTTTTYNGFNQVTGSYDNTYWCNTTFSIVDDRVFNYDWEGNNCN